VAAVNAIQRIVVEATSGSFMLTVSNPSGATWTTAAIDASAPKGDVKTAIDNAYSHIGGGTVSVRKAGSIYYVTFGGGPLAGHAIPLLVAHDLGLGNGASAGGD